MPYGRCLAKHASRLPKQDPAFSSPQILPFTYPKKSLLEPDSCVHAVPFLPSSRSVFPAFKKTSKKKEKRGLKKKKKSSCITAWRSFLNLIQDFSPFPPAAYLPLWGLPHLKSITFLVWGRDRKASGWLRVFSSPPICGMTREQPSWRALWTPWLSCATLCVSLQQKPVSSLSTCMLLCRLSLGIK